VLRPPRPLTPDETEALLARDVPARLATPNRQVRAIGNAELFSDADAWWTRHIDEKYIRGPAAAAQSTARAAHPRTVIRVRPIRLVAVASV
jgi:hypothetical protein